MKSKPCIAHSVNTWLPLTMVWLHGQLSHMDGYRHLVLARTTENLAAFPWSPLCAIPNPARRLAHRLYRRLGGKGHPAQFHAALKRFEPGLLHSHFGNLGWHDLPLARRHGLKHIVTFYGADVNKLPTQNPVWKKRYKELFKKADLILCEGPHMAGMLRGLGCPAKKVAIQRLGVDVKNIPFRPRKVAKDGIVRFLIAASFTEKKGIPYAVEAFARLREKYPNIRLTIVGNAPNARAGAERARILKTIARNRLGRSCKLTGYIGHKELLKLACDHHVFLSPSVTAADGDTEGGSPVSIAEMAASGMPVLSTQHCDIPEVVKDGVTGMLAAERDPIALSRNAERLLKDPRLILRMGDAGSRHIRKNFDIRPLADGLKARYESILGRRGE